ncbi:MAG: NAD(P)H-dependent oxidoreductase subunit E [Candidatus Tectimicrobiota bacterium]
MDLRVRSAPPSVAERAAVDAVLGPPEADWTEAGRVSPQAVQAGRTGQERRHLLLPALHALQDCRGWISPEGLDYLCQRLDLAPAEAYGVASFYALFSVLPQPPVVAHVCDDLACVLRGAEALCTDLAQRLGPAGTPGASGQATWQRSPCLGLCERAPAVFMRLAGEAPRDQTLAPVSRAELDAALQGRLPAVPATQPLPQTGSPALRLLRRVGVVDPSSLDAYRASGGYVALRRALELGPEGVLREVTEAKLLGRGGAAFPVGRKWEAVARSPVQPHYLICNADESEPGTFKDRILMEGDPFAVIEAMTIAGLATGCQQGYLYIRGEYPEAQQRLAQAIVQARARGFLGAQVMGQGSRFEIELRRGAGAYICGEETALLNSLEGYRGEPRNKPPFPVQVGLFGKPTVVNNVETLVNILEIVEHGGAAFAALGTPEATGSKLFCLSGSVQRPGLYEVPFGTTLRALLELAGGLRPGRALQAVLLGGASGTLVSPEQLDTPLTFTGVRAIGASLGSGVVLVLDDTVSLRAMLQRIAAFFRDESCGQCVPCRVGTVRQEELLARLLSGDTLGTVQDEVALLAELSQVMRDASICGLGHTATNAITSALPYLHVSTAARPL